MSRVGGIPSRPNPPPSIAPWRPCTTLRGRIGCSGLAVVRARVAACDTSQGRPSMSPHLSSASI